MFAIYSLAFTAAYKSWPQSLQVWKKKKKPIHMLIKVS